MYAFIEICITLSAIGALALLPAAFMASTRRGRAVVSWLLGAAVGTFCFLMLFVAFVGGSCPFCRAGAVAFYLSEPHRLAAFCVLWALSVLLGRALSLGIASLLGPVFRALYANAPCEVSDEPGDMPPVW